MPMREFLSDKDLSVPRGSLALVLFNVYSSLMLKTGHLTAIFDPVKLSLDKHHFAVPEVDAIIITHEHSDHFDEKLVLAIARMSQATIITTPFIAGRLEKAAHKVHGLRAGDSVTVKGVTFYAEHCQHAANEPLAFIIKTDAATIYHPGDSNPFPEMATIDSRYQPEILLYLGTSKKNLIEIAEMVKPDIIVTYHDPRFTTLELPNTELRQIGQFQVFRYPLTPSP